MRPTSDSRLTTRSIGPASVRTGTLLVPSATRPSSKRTTTSPPTPTTPRSPRSTSAAKSATARAASTSRSPGVGRRSGIGTWVTAWRTSRGSTPRCRSKPVPSAIPGGTRFTPNFGPAVRCWITTNRRSCPPACTTITARSSTRTTNTARFLRARCTPIASAAAIATIRIRCGSSSRAISFARSATLPANTTRPRITIIQPSRPAPAASRATCRCGPTW